MNNTPNNSVRRVETRPLLKGIEDFHNRGFDPIGRNTDASGPVMVSIFTGEEERGPQGGRPRIGSINCARDEKDQNGPEGLYTFADEKIFPLRPPEFIEFPGGTNKVVLMTRSSERDPVGGQCDRVYEINLDTFEVERAGLYFDRHRDEIFDAILGTNFPEISGNMILNDFCKAMIPSGQRKPDNLEQLCKQRAAEFVEPRTPIVGHETIWASERRRDLIALKEDLDQSTRINPDEMQRRREKNFQRSHKQLVAPRHSWWKPSAGLSPMR